MVWPACLWLPVLLLLRSLSDHESAASNWLFIVCVTAFLYARIVADKIVEAMSLSPATPDPEDVL